MLQILNGLCVGKLGRTPEICFITLLLQGLVSVSPFHLACFAVPLSWPITPYMGSPHVLVASQPSSLSHRCWSNVKSNLNCPAAHRYRNTWKLPCLNIHRFGFQLHPASMGWVISRLISHEPGSTAIISRTHWDCANSQLIQWMGLREHLQETMVFSRFFLSGLGRFCKYSLQPILGPISWDIWDRYQK